MRFYDLHVNVTDINKIEEIVDLAKRMGYSGIGLTVRNLDQLKKLKEKIKDIHTNLDLVACAEIEADGVKQMKREISKFRKEADIIIVSGGEYNINRAASEDERVDIISHPEYKRKDSGMDDIIARSATEKNVAIEIDFHEILETYRKIRSHVMNHISKNIRICKKYKTPIIITSNSIDKWTMRDPRELAAIGQILGMDLKDSMDSVSSVPELLVQSNRRKMNNYK